MVNYVDKRNKDFKQRTKFDVVLHYNMNNFTVTAFFYKI